MAKIKISFTLDVSDDRLQGEEYVDTCYYIKDLAQNLSEQLEVYTAVDLKVNDEPI